MAKRRDLTTGGLAVVGATIVGLRQAAIAERQTHIAERQTSILAAQADLERMKLRADLFERRMQTYEITASLLSNIGRLEIDSKEDAERIYRYAEKMRESQFIFRSEVHLFLYDVWCKSLEVRAARSEMIAKKLYPPAESVRAYQEGTVWAVSHLDKLADIFGPDLNVEGHDL